MRRFILVLNLLIILPTFLSQPEMAQQVEVNILVSSSNFSAIQLQALNNGGFAIIYNGSLSSAIEAVMFYPNGSNFTLTVGQYFNNFMTASYTQSLFAVASPDVSSPSNMTVWIYNYQAVQMATFTLQNENCIWYSVTTLEALDIILLANYQNQDDGSFLYNFYTYGWNGSFIAQGNYTTTLPPIYNQIAVMENYFGVLSYNYVFVFDYKAQFQNNFTYSVANEVNGTYYPPVIIGNSANTIATDSLTICWIDQTTFINCNYYFVNGSVFQASNFSSTPYLEDTFNQSVIKIASIIDGFVMFFIGADRDQWTLAQYYEDFSFTTVSNAYGIVPVSLPPWLSAYPNRAGYVLMLMSEDDYILTARMVALCSQPLYWTPEGCLTNYPPGPSNNSMYNNYTICPIDGQFQYNFCCVNSLCSECANYKCYQCSSGSAVNSTGNSCELCPIGTADCVISGGQFNASSCDPGYQMINFVCCPEQATACEYINGQVFATFCANYYLSIGGLCCPPESLSCQINNGILMATNCSIGYELLDNICCPANSASCYLNLNSNDTIIIESCNQGYYLIDNTCSECPGGCEACLPGPTNPLIPYCNLCDIDQYLFEGACLATCPGNLTINGLYCCPINCANCGQGSSICTACDTDYYIYDDGCVNSCPTLYVPSSQGICITQTSMCELACDVSYLCTLPLFSSQCEITTPIITVIIIFSIVCSLVKLVLMNYIEIDSFFGTILLHHSYSDAMVCILIVVIFDPVILETGVIVPAIYFYGNLLGCAFTVELFFMESSR